jgi:hypothetical protein
MATMTPIQLQRQYFDLLEDLFTAATGEAAGAVPADAIRDLMIDRLRYDSESFRQEVNDVADRLQEFYQQNTNAMFDAAKAIGGVKLVLGGGSGFGDSHEAAVRKMLLYCDAVLIPDPIARFFEADRFDQAIDLQMAQDAHRLLKLRPLVFAELNNPALLVFPSLERLLEDHDVATQTGIEHLIVTVVNDSCGVSLGSLADVFSYARKREQEFFAGAAGARLLIAPGAEIADAGDPKRMVEVYLQGLQGRRDPDYLAKLQAERAGVIGATLLSERLSRQFHLLDNARSFGGQPILTAPAQWHYYELAARAEVEQLVRENVISSAAFTTLRSIQDPKLNWLGDIPADLIAELLQKGENREFRSRLQGFTQQLHSVVPAELESTTREVIFGINALIAAHQQEILAIQRRYAPKYKNTLLMGIVSAVCFLPALAPLTGPVVPLLAGGGVAVNYVREKLQERADKRQARSSLLGVLAATAPKAK